jgi:hypothetical protein
VLRPPHRRKPIGNTELRIAVLKMFVNGGFRNVELPTDRRRGETGRQQLRYRNLARSEMNGVGDVDRFCPAARRPMRERGDLSVKTRQQQLQSTRKEHFLIGQPIPTAEQECSMVVRVHVHR